MPKLIDADALKAAIDAMPDLSSPPSDLQAQLDAALAANVDLQKKNDDASASLSAEVAQDASDVALAKALQDKIDAAKAALS